MSDKICSEDGTYDYITATVTEEGVALDYRCTGLSISGSDFVDDETANTWTDADVRKIAATYLGVTDGKHLIEVVHD